MKAVGVLLVLLISCWPTAAQDPPRAYFDFVYFESTDGGHSYQKDRVFETFKKTNSCGNIEVTNNKIKADYVVQFIDDDPTVALWRGDTLIYSHSYSLWGHALRDVCDWIKKDQLPTPPGASTSTSESLDAVLWVQTSVEYRAAASQTYLAAEAALLEGLHDPQWTALPDQTGSLDNLRPAVILDLDETVLDNSSYQAYLVAQGKSYPEKWDEWTEEEKENQNAGLVPGAREFLEFAEKNNVVPIYITNRVCDPSNPKDPTVVLLQELNVPLDNPVGAHLLCKPTLADDDKQSRREETKGCYRILAMFGDQLGDFIEEPLTVMERRVLFEKNKWRWGLNWFQLPNPMYGSWLNAIGRDKVKALRPWVPDPPPGNN